MAREAQNLRTVGFSHFWFTPSSYGQTNSYQLFVGMVEKNRHAVNRSFCDKMAEWSFLYTNRGEQVEKRRGSFVIHWKIESTFVLRLTFLRLSKSSL